MIPAPNWVLRCDLVEGMAAAIPIGVMLQYVVNISDFAMLPLLKALITSASLQQVATTHTCSLAINARSALLETE